MKHSTTLTLLADSVTFLVGNPVNGRTEWGGYQIVDESVTAGLHI
jgi:hypothetical protein